MKGKEDRRALPCEPPEVNEPLPTDAAGIDDFNSKMFSYYNGVSLYQCEGCGRSFNSEAFEKHRKRCPGEASLAASAPGGGTSRGAKQAGAPSTGFTCYWCVTQVLGYERSFFCLLLTALFAMHIILMRKRSTGSLLVASTLF